MRSGRIIAQGDIEDGGWTGQEIGDRDGEERADGGNDDLEESMLNNNILASLITSITLSSSDLPSTSPHLLGFIVLALIAITPSESIQQIGNLRMIWTE